MSEQLFPAAPRFVGQRLERLEDPRFLTGRGRFVADIKLPGMLHAAFLRSPHPHARILSIETSQARALPGVVGIYTGADIHPDLAMPLTVTAAPPHGKTCHILPLAAAKVRFVGDPLALVVATNRYIAEDALDLISVEYDPLPAVVDVEQALQPDAPRLDESLEDNCLAVFEDSTGDVAGAFAAADRVISAVFRQNRQTHAPMETRGCIADWNSASETLECYTSTQVPHIIWTVLSDLLGLPAHRVRVIAPDVGGGFGQKSELAREDVAVCLVARRLGRPVKWIEDRRESLMASYHAREEICYLDVAVTNDGRLLGMRTRFLTDAGAYLNMLFNTSMFTLFGVTGIVGPWKCANLEYKAYTVATNKCPQAPYRAPPLMSNLVSEGIMEIIAQELGIDPAEVRRKNIIRVADLPYTSPMGFPLIGATLETSLERALDLIAYADFRAEQTRARAQGRYLGLGLCTFFEVGAPVTAVYHMFNVAYVRGWDSAIVRVEPSGQVRVMVGISPHGQGHATTLAQIVADELGITPHDVLLQHGDTARDPYGFGTQAARSTVVGGGATLAATRQVRAKIFRIAGQLLEAAPEDLELRGNGRIGVKGVPNRETTIRDVAHAAHFNTLHLPEGDTPGLEATGRYEAPLATSNATHACMLEVDIETGKVTLLKYLVVEDCGTVINPLVVEGQLLGGITQGLGGVLYEEAAYDAHGQFLAGSFMDYTIPKATEVPRVLIEHLHNPAPNTPCGAKPMAEGGVMGAAPAVMNAVADALAPFGVRTTSMPLTPSRIRDLLRQAQSEGRL